MEDRCDVRGAVEAVKQALVLADWTVKSEARRQKRAGRELVVQEGREEGKHVDFRELGWLRFFISLDDFTILVVDWLRLFVRFLLLLG
jgi:hypothetical protein